MGMHIQIRDLKPKWVMTNIAVPLKYTYIEACYEYDQFHDWEIYVDVKEYGSGYFHCSNEAGIPVTIGDLKPEIISMIEMCLCKTNLNMAGVIGFIQVNLPQSFNDPITCSKCFRNITREFYFRYSGSSVCVCKNCGGYLGKKYGGFSFVF